MSDRPARQTRAATSRRRRSWSGWGEGRVDEKDGVGVFLDDVAYAFADVSVPSIPVLYGLLVGAGTDWFGLKAFALVAWLTMVAGAALVRGGWVTPLATDAPGWVAVTPWLVALRLVYYNATLAVAAYGGRGVAAAWSPVAAAVGAFFVGALSVALFPRVAESFYGVVAD
ncbi:MULTISPECIES: hypothetical protein [Halorussus]|uniref:hypothetical protein n=1 Tax=Halorussus TaxID=1070314 RepID=UPI000E20F6E3|nr:MULTISPECIES: hypothetical protein [Halorussus]NHN59123.1 hypothetical protein [Halorussus sp. JP-T4]